MRDWKLGSICAAVMLMASTAMGALGQQQPGAAQPGGGQGGGRGGGQGRFGGRGGGPLTIVGVPADLLATELKLNDDQKAKIMAIRDKMQQDIQATRPAGGAPADPQAQNAKRREINQQAVKDIEAVLTSEQKAQEPDLIKNLSALRSTGLPLETYSDLKLTDDQKVKLVAVAADVDKERAQKMQDLQAARQAGEQDKVQQITQSLRGNGAPNEKALAILTDSQKETVSKYQKDHPRRGGGGARPGGAAPPPPVA